MALLLFALIFWALPLYVAYEQGKAKNRVGLAWGLLGWLGVLALAALPSAPKPPAPNPHPEPSSIYDPRFKS